MILAGVEDRCTFTWEISQSSLAGGVQTCEVSHVKFFASYNFGGSGGWVYFFVGNFSLCVSV